MTNAERASVISSHSWMGPSTRDAITAALDDAEKRGAEIEREACALSFGDSEASTALFKGGYGYGMPSMRQTLVAEVRSRIRSRAHAPERPDYAAACAAAVDAADKPGAIRTDPDVARARELGIPVKADTDLSAHDEDAPVDPVREAAEALIRYVNESGGYEERCPFCEPADGEHEEECHVSRLTKALEKDVTP